MKLFFIFCCVILTKPISSSQLSQFLRSLSNEGEENGNGRVMESVKMAYYTDENGVTTEKKYVQESGNGGENVFRRDTGRKKRCPSLDPPKNGTLTCDTPGKRSRFRNCSAVCNQYFVFPNGSNEIKFNCTRTSDGWNKIDPLPDCIPARKPVDCNILYDKSGRSPHCSETSTSQTCRLNCNLGHRFPNGQRSMTITCNKFTGKYTPIRTFPKCIAAGEPIRCNILYDRSGRSPHCSESSIYQTCRLECKTGHRFPNGQRSMTIACNKHTGKYTPARKFPKCQKQ